jgi:hypothetical protein
MPTVIKINFVCHCVIRSGSQESDAPDAYTQYMQLMLGMVSKTDGVRIAVVFYSAVKCAQIFKSYPVSSVTVT